MYLAERESRCSSLSVALLTTAASTAPAAVSNFFFDLNFFIFLNHLLINKGKLCLS